MRKEEKKLSPPFFIVSNEEKVLQVQVLCYYGKNYTIERRCSGGQLPNSRKALCA